MVRNVQSGQLIIFRGSLTECCVGSIPSPIMEVGRPRSPLENYDVVSKNGLDIYLNKELAYYNGVVEIGLKKNLWWKSLSFRYDQIDAHAQKVAETVQWQIFKNR